MLIYFLISSFSFLMLDIDFGAIVELYVFLISKII